MVLTCDERNDRSAIGEGEDAGFEAVEPFLQDQFVARLAEHATDHDLINGVERLAKVIADEDPFARRQTVRLDHHAKRPAEDVVACLGGRAECAFLTALFKLDLHTWPKLLTWVHDAIDGFKRLRSRSAMQRMT